MKCPFKLMHAPYDGGDGCDGDCALSMVFEVTDRTFRCCALAVLAQSADASLRSYGITTYGIKTEEDK